MSGSAGAETGAGTETRPPRIARRRALGILAASAGGLLGLTACQPARFERRQAARPLVLRINVHASAGYAPLVQMRERRLLERAVPGLTIEWKAIPSVEAINDALTTGGLDVAAGPPTAFFLAREAGLPVRLVAGLAALPCMVVGRAGLHSLAALADGDQIAVPEEASFEEAVLQLAALRELGDPLALARRTVIRQHPDAVPAMKLGKDLAAHVAVTPYLEIELEGAGPRPLIDSRELFGGLATTSLLYALPALQERQAPLLAALGPALAEASGLLAEEPTETARLLTEAEELRLTPERLGNILARSGWQPGPRLAGVTAIADLWRRTGRLRRTPTTWGELAFAGVPGN